MSVIEPIKAEWFRVDQSGIDALKNRCFNDAREFSYFRKRKWAGILASIENAEAFQSAFPAFTMSPAAAYPGAKELIRRAASLVTAGPSTVSETTRKFWRRRHPKHHISRRVICTRLVRTSAIARWEAICGDGGVATIPDSRVGPFTYVVSERMWAIFTRFGKNDLRGVRGTDAHTIAMLREKFDLEFLAAKMRAK